jgi:hypothetical protein
MLITAIKAPIPVVIRHRTNTIVRMEAEPGKLFMWSPGLVAEPRQQASVLIQVAVGLEA